jgi:hypothetical protein
MAKTIIVKLDGETEKLFDRLKEKYKIDQNVEMVKFCIIKTALK